MAARPALAAIGSRRLAARMALPGFLAEAEMAMAGARIEPGLAQELDRALGQLADEPGRDAGLPEIVHAPVGGVADMGALPSAGEPDIGEPPLFLESLLAVLVERARMREQTLLPARQEHRVEFHALGAVQGHHAPLIAIDRLGVLHHQRHMLEES